MKMNEGRQAHIVLLDDHTLDILVKPRLLSSELLDLVSSHFSIKEKEYFGLAYLDESSHFNWLTLDKRVLEHEYPKKTGPLTLYFAIRFYINSITQLRDKSTVEAFVVSAQNLIFKGEIECDSETAFELAAHVLQAHYLDHESDEKTKEELKKLPVLPTSALKEHPSIAYCEQRVIYHYQTLAGTEKGLALVNYMTIVESLPTYGIHYYEVKDKKDLPWWLGISFKGIAVYDKNDKKTPRRLFTWRQLENLYYRDRKFSIEVHDPKRVVQSLSSFNLYEDAIKERAEKYDSLSHAVTDPTTQVSVSRRALGPGNVNVHAWFLSTPQLTKCVWSMAVAQHQFYLDRKHSRSQLPAARSMSEIAAELSRSTVSLAGSNISSDLSTCTRSISTHSLPSLSASKYELNFEDLEKTRAAQRDMFDALKARKDALEEKLKKKLDELKLLCVKEGELSGELPPETPIHPGESAPLIRRRIGTAFSLSPSVIQRSGDEGEDNELSQLELEYDLQCKISNAALRLSKDKTIPKKLRKQRHVSYQKAQAKLKETGLRLAAKRKEIGLVAKVDPFIKPAEYGNTIGRTDSGMYSESSMMSSDESLISRQYSSSKNLQDSCYSSDSSRYSSSYTSIPPPHANLPATPNNQICRHSAGYITSPIYATQTQYRTRRYPTLSSSATDSISLRREPRYGSEDSIRDTSASRLALTSRYDSMEELKSSADRSGLHNNSYNEANRLASPPPPPPLQPQSVSRTSLQEASPSYYGSLDRMKQRQKAKEQRMAKKAEERAPHDMSPLETRLSEMRVAPVGRDGSPVQPAYRDQIVRSRQPPQYDAYSTCSTPGLASSRASSADMSFVSPSRVTSPDNVSYVSRRSDLARLDHTYSPRYVEGAYRYYERQRHEPKIKRHSGGHLVVRRESPAKNLTESPTSQQPVNVADYSPHVETTKPYEMADFYKYSERFRRRRAVEYYHQALMNGDQASVASFTSQLSNDSDQSFQSPARRYVQNSARSSPVGSSSRSSDMSTPLTHRPPPGPYSGSHSKHPTQYHNDSNPYTPYNNAATSQQYLNNSGTFPPNYANNTENYPATTCVNHAVNSGHGHNANNATEYRRPPSYETTIMNFANNSPTAYSPNGAYNPRSHGVYSPPRPLPCDPVVDTSYDTR